MKRKLALVIITLSALACTSNKKREGTNIYVGTYALEGKSVDSTWQVLMTVNPDGTGESYFKIGSV